MAAQVLLLALLVGPAGQAAAGELDPDTGRLVSAGPYAWGFEGRDFPGHGELRITASDPDEQDLGFDDVSARFVTDGAAGPTLEGRRMFLAGGRAATVTIDLRAIQWDLWGRRVEVRLWYRPVGTGTRPRATLRWGRLPGTSMSLPFLPTGRGTSDGWRELVAGPVDFDAGAVFPLASVVLADAQVPARGGQVRRDPEATYVVDALEVLDLGPAAVPSAACTLATETAACGAYGACLVGRCVDAGLVFGPLPPPPFRQGYLARKAWELYAIDGVRGTKDDLAGLAAEFQALAGTDSPREFWLAIRAAYQRLQDGHANAPIASATLYRLNSGACLHLGSADLLPEGGDAPLVFRVDPRVPFAAKLAPGDVLRRIDGLPAYAWMALAKTRLPVNGDPAADRIWATSDLLAAAMRLGARAEFARCAPAPDGTVAPCAEDRIETIVVDFADELGPGLWWGMRLPDWALLDGLPCDPRFLRAVESPQADDYAFAGFADLPDGTRVIQFNGVPHPSEDGGAWMSTVEAAVADAPGRVILDQRRGDGGTADPVLFVASLFMDRGSFPGFDLFPWTDGPAEGAALATLVGCGDAQSPWKGPMSYGLACGNYDRFRMPEGPPPLPDTRLVVLTGLDASGNDFLSEILAHRDPAVTRLVGMGPCLGAFGAINTFPAYGFEHFGGSMQVQDSAAAPVALAGPPLAFLSGHGTQPHDRVVQRQSDAVLGRDTLLERARAWLDGEVTP
jgi:hypothetical protein